MTLGIVWVRSTGGIRELVVASDSRLSGGQYWDSNPKIMLLPRTDAVLSFSGFTYDAYPLMLQAWNTIRMHPPASERSMDLADLKGHLIRVFNHSRSFISGLPKGQIRPDPAGALFALSGYSWRTQQFHIWKLHFDSNINRYTFRPTHKWGGQKKESYKLIAFLGDDAPVNEAKKKLINLLRLRQKIEGGSFDMEPFEILRDIIRSERFPSVGGPIQVVKIYEHSNSVPLGVYWPNKTSGNVSILGRPLMKYETIPWGVLDPDNPDRARPMFPKNGSNTSVSEEL